MSCLSLQQFANASRKLALEVDLGGIFDSLRPIARGLVRCRAPADSGRFRRKRAPILPWVLDFCAVFGGSCSLLALPTWGNAGVLWCFGPIRPAKPPRSLQMRFACVEDGAS